MTGCAKLGSLQITVVVLGSVVMFAGWHAFQYYLSDPFLVQRCQQSCNASESTGSLRKGYVGSRTSFRCRCNLLGAPGQSRHGYFFVSNALLEWLLLLLFRLVPIALILFTAFLVLGKLLMRWRR